MKLPEYLELCPVCNGKGEYRQMYTAGCGGGYFKMMGPCNTCKHSSKLMEGLGYRMKNGNEVPKSVINQVEVMNANSG